MSAHDFFMAAWLRIRFILFLRCIYSKSGFFLGNHISHLMLLILLILMLSMSPHRCLEPTLFLSLPIAFSENRTHVHTYFQRYLLSSIRPSFHQLVKHFYSLLLCLHSKSHWSHSSVTTSQSLSGLTLSTLAFGRTSGRCSAFITHINNYKGAYFRLHVRPPWEIF